MILFPFVVAGLAALPFLAGDYTLGLALGLLSWIALAQSWVILSGMAGYISLGHAVFFGLGAYVAASFWNVLPLPLLLLASGTAAAAFAAIVGWPVLRVRGPYFVILTFGLAEFTKFAVINTEAALGVFSRLMMGGPEPATLYWLMLALAAIATAVTWAVRQSRFGAGLRAIRENEEAAETLGVPVARFKLIAYVLSAIIPGMVGALMTMRTGYFETLQAFSPTVSFTIITMAIIGGSDDAPGPLLGACFLVALSELLWVNAPQAYMIVLGLMLIGFIQFCPRGLYGLMRRGA